MTDPLILEQRLRSELRGDVLFDAFSRGRYSTDASIYQVEPVGVVVPQDLDDAARALEIAVDARVPILPRGAGTSQCGQAVGAALVIDSTKRLDRILEIDAERATAWVEPGVVLDRLNAALKPQGLWFPVDVSTSAQATLGGMTGNNSCGARSIRYGNMVHNVLAAEAWLTSGEVATFRDCAALGERVSGPPGYQHLVEVVRGLYGAEHEELERRVPKLLRRVAGYNLDHVSMGPFNMAHLLVGSEGTLAYLRRIKLKLSPLPAHRVLGVAHFPSFHAAMDAAQHIVALAPAAVELVDRTMIELSRRIEAFRPTVESSVRGDPDAILLVEFAGDDRAHQVAQLNRLVDLLGDLGHSDGMVRIIDAAAQKAVWEVRKAGLNIMMSMKGDGKPVSFIEDCAVPLEHLAEYTARLTEVFAKHGTRGTWYAHASVGCLHVRPILDMRKSGDVVKMRAIAEEACALVREYRGSFSGEHGDGLVRSEWIEPIYGPRLTRAFASIKHAFDPAGLMNPGKIVASTKMDDRELFRFKPDYSTPPIATALDWSEHEVGEPNAGRGFAAAVEMCNNNGYCRKLDAGAMCPSYRVTRDEQHLTRGRANTLRLALSGQLGPGALTSPELYDTMELCVSCKACRRECPTGVDMARMKIEFLSQYYERHSRPLRDRLIAHLPRLAPRLSRLRRLVNLRDRVPGLGLLSEVLLGFSARRTLPVWRADPFAGRAEVAEAAPDDKERVTGELVLFPDTFNTYFEPENLRAAVAFLEAAGYRLHVLEAADRERPLCCGRTYLAAGMVDEAREEWRRLLAAVGPYVERGVPIVGLEPSCVLGFRDELGALLPGPEAASVATRALTFEEFVLEEHRSGRLRVDLAATQFKRALVHGHCHQKAFDLVPAVVDVLSLVPGLEVETVPSSCCGMAGAFGYDARHVETSFAMAEQTLLPAVRDCDDDTVVIADGTSCRHQIADGAGRNAWHAARLLAAALPAGEGRG